MRLTRPPAAIVLVLAVGAAYRLWSFVANPSLPGDDASLALSVIPRSYGELLEPLDYGQVAPPLFLLALRLAVAVGGANEFALRALPLVAGLLLPLAVWRVALRLMDPAAALLAAWLVALSPILGTYSYVVKPYELDALIGVGLLGLTLDILDRPGRSRSWWLLGVAGVAAILASTPAFFLLAGVGVALWISASGERAWAHRGRVGALGGVWGGVFILTYAAFYGDVARDGYMQQFWAAGFLSLDSPLAARRTVELVARLPLSAFDTSRLPVWATIPFWVLLAGGWIYLARRHVAAVALLALPLAAVLIAGAMRRYPISPRLLVFAAPLIMLSYAAGVAAARQRWPGARAARLLNVGIGLWLATLGVVALRRPYRGKGMRHAVAELERRGVGEPVYVYAGAVPLWAFYTTRWSAPDTARLRFLARVAGPGGPAFHNAPGRGRRVAAGEGDALSWCVGGERVELIGLAPGMQAGPFGVFSQRGADSGWAEREAERIAAVADRDAWLVLATVYPTTGPALLGALQRRGAEQIETWAERGAELYRYRFTGPGSGGGRCRDQAATAGPGRCCAGR